jgi:hypothetical protein
MRARLSAAHRRAETDPERVAQFEAAKLAKRVQIAKREAGIPDANRPLKFMGMDPKQHAEAVDACVLPPAMTTLRKVEAKPAKKKAKKK